MCMAAFSPIDNFTSSWDKDELIKLAKFYPSDFTSTEMNENHLPTALRLFHTEMRKDGR